jgi:hypothetical protein
MIQTMEETKRMLYGWATSIPQTLFNDDTEKL